MTVRFELSKKMDDTQKKQILVRVSVSREFRVSGKTKMFISPKNWNEKTNSVRKTSRIENPIKARAVEELRDQLNNLQLHISKAVIDTKDLEKMITKEEKQNWLDFVIDSFYNPCIKLIGNQKLTFEEFAKIYVEVRSREENWKPAIKGQINKKKIWDNPSFDKLSAVQTQVLKMNPHLLMTDITNKTLDEYQSFLIKEGYCNNTIINHINYFKQILKWADEKGYLKNGRSVLNHKTPKLNMASPKAVNFLKWDEFMKLYNYEFDELEKHLELTRDRFCFSCLTSLRHSDLEILKKAHFDDFDNPTSFSFVSKKTNDSLTIYLHRYAKELYQKYKDVPTKNGLLFPPKSNQKMNNNLKIIAERLGFTRLISRMQYSGKDRIEDTQRLCDVIATHSARRTFVVHALEQGWSPQLVMTYTGHEDYDSMKPDIAITDMTRKNVMDNNF